MSDLAKRIGGLSPEKRALLERKLLQRQATSALSVPIVPRDRSQPTPLSFSQVRLWFLDQLDPGQPTYNAALAMWVDGELDLDRLRAAVEVVVGRHEAIRTVFREIDHRPRSVVLEEWTLPWEVLDVQGEPHPDGAALAAARDASRAPFDLANDVMLRLHLVRTGERRWLVTFIEHHIAFDGWSDGIMFSEIAALYTAAGEGTTVTLPEIPVQYGDFAVWQHQQLQGGALEHHVGYWRERLSGAPEVLELPRDRPRPPQQTYGGSHHPLDLPQTLAEGMRQLARDDAATPYMVGLTLFAAALTRWSGQTDLCFGTPIANRGKVELEQVIGFFSNTLVLRIDASGDPSFRTLLGRVKEAALGAYEHQDLPFEKVVEALAPNRDPRWNPLFQVNFRLQSSEPPHLVLPGVQIEPLEFDVGFSRFDLALELQLHPQAFTGYVEYNLDLFRAATAEWLGGALEVLLRGALAEPDAPLSQLEFPEAVRATSSIRGARGRRS